MTASTDSAARRGGRGCTGPRSAGLPAFDLAMCCAGLGALAHPYADAAGARRRSARSSGSARPSRPRRSSRRAPGALARACCRRPRSAIRWASASARCAPGLLAALLTLLGRASAPTFGDRSALRALAGAVLAGVVAVAMGHVGSEVAPERLGSAMGLDVAGNSLGGSVAG